MPVEKAKRSIARKTKKAEALADRLFTKMDIAE